VALGVRTPRRVDAHACDVPLEVRAAVVVVVAERGEAVREAAERAEGEERDEEGAFHDEISRGSRMEGSAFGARAVAALGVGRRVREPRERRVRVVVDVEGRARRREAVLLHARAPRLVQRSVHSIHRPAQR
jgi:hypothetical protein